MKIEITLIIVGFILSANIAKCQTLKTYSGNYEGGEATYQYYENTEYERIYQGKFSYKQKSITSDIRGSLNQEIIINGSFNENKKNGIWSGKEIWSGSFMGNGSSTKNIKGNYDNGLRTGQWTFSNTFIKNNKSEVVTSSLNFKNDSLVGIINLEGIKGQLDNNGFFIGHWRVVDDDKEYLAEFKNNLLVKLIGRRMSNGDIFLKYDTPILSNLQTDSIPIAEANSYTLKDVYNINLSNNELGFKQIDGDRYGDFLRDKGRYFADFFNYTFKKIRNFDEIMKDIELGSSPIKIMPPQAAILKIQSEEEKQKIEEAIQKQKDEEDRIQKEKIRLEEERLESLVRKQKSEDAVSTGNVLFKKRKFKDALTQYKLANSIESSNIIYQKIKAAQDEIDKIILMQKKRYEIYTFLWNKNSALMMDMIKLKTSLESKKKVYGENYEKCMNLLSANFSSYFSISKVPKMNITNASIIEENWGENDQAEYDLLLRFKEEMKECEKFHYKVMEANINNDKRQLKLLKSSDNPTEIIAKF